MNSQLHPQRISEQSSDSDSGSDHEVEQAKPESPAVAPKEASSEEAAQSFGDIIRECMEAEKLRVKCLFFFWLFYVASFIAANNCFEPFTVFMLFTPVFIIRRAVNEHINNTVAAYISQRKK